MEGSAYASLDLSHNNRWRKTTNIASLSPSKYRISRTSTPASFCSKQLSISSYDGMSVVSRRLRKNKRRNCWLGYLISFWEGHHNEPQAISGSTAQWRAPHSNLTESSIPISFSRLSETYPSSFVAIDHSHSIETIRYYYSCSHYSVLKLPFEISSFGEHATQIFEIWQLL